MSEHAFAQALLDPEAALPAGIVDPEGRPAPKRFSVYRNNVASSLTRALEAAFPTVRALVGEAFFGAMAVAFLREHPPTSPMLMLYGAALPGWLERFPPVAGLGYLPDIARLDQAMRESYHAADSAPLGEAAFQRLLGADIAGLRLALAPSLRLVRSRWPIHAIRAASLEGGPPPQPGPQDVAILRPEFDPAPQLLPPGGGALLQALIAGRSLGESLHLAGEGADLPGLLALLIANSAISGVTD
jgi:Putative DNA-binding domain